MDISSLLSTMNTQSAQGSGAVQGHHHHHKSPADMVSQLDSAIDDAVKAGKLTSDQASQMKTALSSISDLLKNSQAGSTGATSATDPTSSSGSLANLSADDRQKIRSVLKDVSKQLFAALNPQGTTAAGSTGSSAATAAQSPADALFAAMDTNGDGKIDKSELTSFVNNLSSASGASAPWSGQTYGQQGSFSLSMSMSQSTFEVSA
ncbi:MAG: EF-hand domain-containing protein [Chitinivibrionales bacterium]|nr:EF-hand domain-containing protein [Chitinivibrionales bacterium]